MNRVIFFWTFLEGGLQFGISEEGERDLGPGLVSRGSREIDEGGLTPVLDVIVDVDKVDAAADKAGIEVEKLGEDR